MYERVTRGCPAGGDGKLYLGTAYVGTGDHGRAEDVLLKVLRLLEGELSREWFGMTGFPAVMARSYLTLIFADRGDFEQGSPTAWTGSASPRGSITPTA